MSNKPSAPIPPYARVAETERLVVSVESVVIPFVYDALRASYFHKKCGLEAVAKQAGKSYLDPTEAGPFLNLMETAAKINIRQEKIQPLPSRTPFRRALDPQAFLRVKVVDGQRVLSLKDMPTFPITDRVALIDSMKALRRILTSGADYTATLGERIDVSKQLVRVAQNIRISLFEPEIAASVAEPFHLAETHVEEKYLPHAGVSVLAELKEKLDRLKELQGSFPNPVLIRYPLRTAQPG